MEMKILRLKPILFISSILFDFFWSSKPARTQTNKHNRKWGYS